ncbi:MAG: hypothetical protein HZB13_14455 [Acidobacteria bacterium]|nr:hypothetical protein [Acidobacteriota bacterium]
MSPPGAPALLGVFPIACLVAQSPKERKLDAAVLADAPAVGKVHFGPRALPPPAVESCGRL